VAAAMNFSSRQGLTNYFRQWQGLSPAAFRRQHRKVEKVSRVIGTWYENSL
jgi:AraC-like DNA-binding protein